YADSRTESGVFKGRLAYTSPEQACGAPVDRRSDVFAMGVMLWESVTLRRFAKGPATREALDARVQGSELRLWHVEPTVDPTLAAICDRALEVDPEARYATAGEFRAALQGYLAERAEIPSSSELARVMRKHFAQERAEMHGFIDASLKRS